MGSGWEVADYAAVRELVPPDLGLSHRVILLVDAQEKYQSRSKFKHS